MFFQYYGLHQDVGFMWLPTSVANYKVTGNEDSRKRALHAANLLAGRFNLAGGFIRAWNDSEKLDTRGWAIVDCMMNLPLCIGQVKKRAIHSLSKLLWRTRIQQ